jgi:hypothetical protein
VVCRCCGREGQQPEELINGEWREHFSEKHQRAFFENVRTGVSTWTRPVERVTSDTPIAEAVCAFCPT